MLDELSTPIRSNFSQTFQPKNSLTLNDVDNFWADCFPNLSSSMRDKNQLRQLSNEKKKYYRMQLYSNVPSLQYHDDKASSIENRKKEAMEKCCQMYTRAKESHNKRKILIEEVNDKKKNNELSDCTWKPQVNKEKNSQIVHRIVNNQENKIYFRAVEWEYQKQMKQTKRKAVNEIDEMYQLSFRPDVNLNPDLVSVFKKGPDIHDSFSNNAFFFRYNKARIEEREKNDLINKGKSNSPKKMKKSYSNYDMSVRSLKLSKGDSYKKTIHEELFSLELPGTNNN